MALRQRETVWPSCPAGLMRWLPIACDPAPRHRRATCSLAGGSHRFFARCHAASENVCDSPTAATPCVHVRVYARVSVRVSRFAPPRPCVRALACARARMRARARSLLRYSEIALVWHKNATNASLRRLGMAGMMF